MLILFYILKVNSKWNHDAECGFKFEWGKNWMSISLIYFDSSWWKESIECGNASCSHPHENIVITTLISSLFDGWWIDDYKSHRLPSLPLLCFTSGHRRRRRRSCVVHAFTVVIDFITSTDQLSCPIGSTRGWQGIVLSNWLTAPLLLDSIKLYCPIEEEGEENGKETGLTDQDSSFLFINVWWMISRSTDYRLPEFTVYWLTVAVASVSLLGPASLLSIRFFNLSFSNRSLTRRLTAHGVGKHLG